MHKQMNGNCIKISSACLVRKLNGVIFAAETGFLMTRRNFIFLPTEFYFSHDVFLIFSRVS